MRSSTLGFTPAAELSREERPCVRHPVVLGVQPLDPSREGVYIACGESLSSALCLVGVLLAALVGLNVWYFAWA